MLRHIIALGALAAITSPVVAQVDTSRTTSGTNTHMVPRLTYSIMSREGWLGIGLSCSQCRLATPDDGQPHQWTFSEPPTVFSVDRDGPADRAALRNGDTLIAIDGVPLTSAEGGTAFANIRPGQAVRLTYRRNGAERTVRLVAQSHPISDARQMRLAALALQRALAEQNRQLERSRGQIELAREQIERIRAQMEERLGELAQHRVDSAADSLQFRVLRRALEAQAAALAKVLEDRAVLEDSAEAAMPAIVPVPAAPAPGAEPAVPAMPAPAAEPTMPAMPGMPAPSAPPAALAPAPMPPMSYREHRRFGPLRYTGRLGDVVIEARGPGGVTATEVSDSEVVVSSGDLSVRLALRPRATPKPATAPAPARPPRD